MFAASTGSAAPPYYKWKAKYGGLDVSEARRLKVLTDENAKLKKLLAEAMLDNAILKDLAAKNGDARCEAASCGPCLPGFWGEPAAGVHGGRGGSDLGSLPIPEAG